MERGIRLEDRTVRWYQGQVEMLERFISIAHEQGDAVWKQLFLELMGNARKMAEELEQKR